VRLPDTNRAFVRRTLREAGKIDTQAWITHRADFNGAIRGFPGWLEPERGVVKAMISL
jgi:alcohol dehydrogenase